MSRSKLQKLIADLCAEIMELSSEAKVSISYEPFEDVDATIRVYPPTDDVGDTIDEVIHRRTWDILVDEGYHISVLVYEPDGVEPAGALAVAA